MITDQW